MACMEHYCSRCGKTTFNNRAGATCCGEPCASTFDEEVDTGRESEREPEPEDDDGDEEEDDG